MKIPDIGKTFFHNNNENSVPIAQNEGSEKFFDAKFNDMEGLELEKSDTTPPQDKVTVSTTENSLSITKTKYIGEEPVESTETRKNGTIKSTTKQLENGDFEVVVYRENGSVYSKSIYKDFYQVFLMDEVRYDEDGNIANKIYRNEEGQMVNEGYKDGKIYLKDQTDGMSVTQLEERTVYNKDGSIYIHTKYASDGSITESQKNKRTDDPDYDKFYKENLDGDFDDGFVQGMSGSCYFVSTIQSLLNTEKGREVLKNSIDYDKEKGLVTIKFLGAEKEYTFSEQEIQEATGRLSSGDPDFAALSLGYEKYRAEAQGKVIDGGFPTEVMKALTGDEGTSNIIFGVAMPIDKKMLDTMAKNLLTGNHAMVVNTVESSVDTEFSKEDKALGLENSHAYSLKDIDDDFVYVTNPSTQKTIKLSREKFLESFITFADFELK